MLKYDLYWTINYISFFVLLVYNLTKVKIRVQNLSTISLKILEKNKKSNNSNKVRKLLSKEMFLSIIETIVISCVQYLPVKFLNFGFGHLVGTGSNYFALLFFMPYILLIFCWIVRIDPFFQIDLITPAYPLALSISKIACFCEGCCRGVVSTVGLLNHNTGRIEFPIQLLESSVALGIFIFLTKWKKKLKPGIMLPIYTIIYSAIRFATEFLSAKINIIGGFKKYHIFCIIGILVGFVELFIVQKFGDKIKKVCTFKNSERKNTRSILKVEN